MICDAPAQPLEPPAWQLTQAGSSEPSISLGFVTFGTEEQVGKLAAAARQSGLYCGVPGEKDGRVEIMVFFDSRTSREVAFSLYNRVAKGEFGTTNTGLILLPASVAKKK